jgi:sugar/nucleoside kinase (ribokinase family)
MRMNTSKPKVYCYGMIVESNAIKLAGRYPEADGYGEIQEWVFMPSGEACNSAIALSRLGCKVRLDGAWLAGARGGDVIHLLKKQGVDARRLKRSPEGQGFREIVLGDGHTRTVFGPFGRILSGTERYWNRPDERDIAQADFITLDSQFGSVSGEVASIAQRYRKNVTASDPTLDQPLLGTVAAATLSLEHLRGQKLEADPRAALSSFAARMNGLCVITLGSEGLIYARADRGTVQPIQALPAFKIHPVDSLGAGDSFRAALALGLHFGLGDRDALSFSSAVSALVCLSYPGAMNAPNLGDVARFLRERGEEKVADRLPPL